MPPIPTALKNANNFPRNTFKSQNLFFASVSKGSFNLGLGGSYNNTESFIWARLVFIKSGKIILGIEIGLVFIKSGEIVFGKIVFGIKNFVLYLQAEV